MRGGGLPGPINAERSRRRPLVDLRGPSFVPRVAPREVLAGHLGAVTGCDTAGASLPRVLAPRMSSQATATSSAAEVRLPMIGSSASRMAGARKRRTVSRRKPTPGGDEEDTEPAGEHRRPVHQVAQGQQPQSEEHLGAQVAVVVGVQEQERQRRSLGREGGVLGGRGDEERGEGLAQDGEGDGDADRGEHDHRGGGIGVNVTQQPVQRHRCEQQEGRHRQVGHESEAEQRLDAPPGSRRSRRHRRGCTSDRGRRRGRGRRTPRRAGREGRRDGRTGVLPPPGARTVLGSGDVVTDHHPLRGRTGTPDP